MRVPNVNIVLRSDKRHSAVKTKPAWYAEMFRRVWAGRLDAEKGLEVLPIDPDVGADFRYSTYADVGEAERLTVAFFVHGDQQRVAGITQMFHEAFPQGLRPIIEKLLREDLDATRVRLAAARNTPTAHESFLVAGLSEENALALQKAGFARLAEVDTDDLIRLGECGLDAVAMSKIIAAQAPVETISAADPLTAAAKG